MSKIICKSSVLPAGAGAIWKKLQRLDSLQYIAAPYATFEPLGGRKTFTWKSGHFFSLKLKLFGLLPLGIHTIRILIFDREKLTIYSHEGNLHVPVWNHLIKLKPIDDRHTLYTDRVEIDAGRKTPLICLWAELFYAHRQRRWKKLLRLPAK